MSDFLTVLWGTVVLGVIVWGISCIRECSVAVRDLGQQQQKRAQRVFDLLCVRLPQPTESEIRDRARRMAERGVKRRSAVALEAFQKAALKQGPARTKDLKPSEATTLEMRTLEDHLRASALVHFGWSPEDAAKKELLPQDQPSLTNADIEKLTPEQQQRAKQMAELFGATTLDEITEQYRRDLVKEGQLVLDLE